MNGQPGGFWLSTAARRLSLPGVNPTALITGGSRGIGRGIALALARLGHDLVINFRNQEAAARETSDACGRAAREAGHTIETHVFRADIGATADRGALIAFARRTFRQLDLLVNNAGVAPEVRADLLDTTEASFDRLIAVNAKGPFFLTQLAARWMIEPVAGPATAPAYRPTIVTISSVSADTASVNRGDYCVSKAALSMVTPLFAVRLAAHGVTVFEIRPGVIATDMTAPVKAKYDDAIANGLTPIARWGTPDDVGRAVAAIAQDLLPFSTGEVIHVDGGFHIRRL